MHHLSLNLKNINIPLDKSSIMFILSFRYLKEMNMYLATCPICKGELKINELHCPHCNISFKGSFENSWLAELDAGQLEFIRLFLIVQGNLKELQNQLGISYPTVKNRLGEIIGIITKKEPVTDTVIDILSDLNEGFVDVEEAISMIEQRRKK
jgi:hypothetical protein